MTTTYLSDSALAEIERAVMERAGKVERNEIRFRCPCEDHADVHPSARWNPIKTTWYCDVCGAGGGAKDLCVRLGIALPRTGEGRSTQYPVPPNATVQRVPGCTLEQYAEAKLLPVTFLRGIGLSTFSYQGAPSVRIPYRTPSGDEAAVRFRINLEGDHRFRWRSGSKPQLYGQERLDHARERGYVILAEGESDCHSLWFHDEPALGLPGAAAWREDRDAPLLDGIERIYVVIEPDSGGEAVRRWLVRSSIRQRVSLVDLGEYKDPSGLYLDDPDFFLDRWHVALNEATSLTVIHESQTREALAAAWPLAKPLAYEPSILDRAADELAAAGVAGERRTIKLLYLILTSRLLDRPVSAAIKGPSSGGKSYTLERVLQLFPDEAYHSLSAMSERALAYGDEPLEHRFLIIFEAAGLSGDFASYLIRSLLSEGRLRYETVEKTKDGMRPRLIEREGPTGLLVTTTAVRLHPENETRLLSIPVTDTPEQTRAVLRALSRDTHSEVDLAPWHALQTWLSGSEHRMFIPYAEVLSELMPPIAVRMRRDFGMVLTLIRAHAVLHQVNRERDKEGRIVANLDDYASVRTLVADLIAEGVEAAVPPTIRETVEKVRELQDAAVRTRSEGIDMWDDTDLALSLPTIAKALNLDKSAASRRVNAACERQYLRNLQTKRGQPARIVLGEPLPIEVEILPSVEALSERCGIAPAREEITGPSRSAADLLTEAPIANAQC